MPIDILIAKISFVLQCFSSLVFSAEFLAIFLALGPVFFTMCYTAREKKKETQLKKQQDILKISYEMCCLEREELKTLADRAGKRTQLIPLPPEVAYYYNWLTKLLNGENIRTEDLIFAKFLSQRGIELGETEMTIQNPRKKN